ncbi:four helix bundle protein [Hymenobacter chitinivorans]|uniref:Four helix bundle protein n=1 Tax=Hymenobacter chitinivorans DSM 11115 TaxID=1121954 RepID=A0A2M9ASA0_9BACT|nr:four helix bundle protein [Hymenobacter chitinivorans]PJJ48584.1 four helix bundle protein [Hymenobacter chitinivorans DSM 11115]
MDVLSANLLSFNEDLRGRTKQAALRVIYLFQHLPRTGEAAIIGKQLLRSATSVAANFRASCRGRSSAEWYAKLCICVEEADETLFWLELLGDANIVAKSRMTALQKEYGEILSILASIRKKAKQQSKS